MTDTPESPPTLTGVTCWSVGRRDPEQITAERPGQFAVEIMFDDPYQALAWCRWIMAHDEVWGGSPTMEPAP
jgi:hypothetical protein